MLNLIWCVNKTPFLHLGPQTHVQHKNQIEMWFRNRRRQQGIVINQSFHLYQRRPFIFRCKSTCCTRNKLPGWWRSRLQILDLTESVELHDLFAERMEPNKSWNTESLSRIFSARTQRRNSSITNRFKISNWFIISVNKWWSETQIGNQGPSYNSCPYRTHTHTQLWLVIPIKMLSASFIKRTFFSPVCNQTCSVGWHFHLKQ